MAWKPDICIYHFPCDDGFASAWCVWKKWFDTVEHRPTNYDQAIPDQDIEGKNILIADFSFKPEVLSDLAMRANSIVILDHHRTAQADLKDFAVGLCGDAKFVCSDMEGMFRDMAELDRPKILAHFDMDRSGASMTWDFCFPDEPRPKLIEHIQDRDLWKMELPDTRALSLYLRAHEYSFAVWEDIMLRFENEAARSLILNQAAAIEQFYDAQISRIVDTAVFKTIGLHEGVAVAHAPYVFASDLGHELLRRHEDAPFAAIVVDAYGDRTYSLRSEDSRVDVSEVARSFGGGGHRNSAGFRVPV